MYGVKTLLAIITRYSDDRSLSFRQISIHGTFYDMDAFKYK